MARVPLGQMGKGLSCYPYALMYPQDLHEHLLIDRLESLGVKVLRPVELIDFQQNGHGVQALLQRADGTTEICSADYLCGCDGAHSTVRDQLQINFPGGTYSGIFYVADVIAAGPAIDGEIHVELDEADFLAVFPLKGQGSARLIGPAQWPSDRKHEEFTFNDIKQCAIENLQLTIDKVNWFSTYHVHHRVAQHFKKDRAFLLGDAAHIHSPVGGQGMNTGIGDSVNLAWKLAAVLNEEAADSLLESYEPERIAFARRLVATTDRLFSVITKRGPFADIIRTRIFPRVAQAAFRTKLAQRFLFRTVSQIGVQYRSSPLSKGVAGDLHGGDRLPWVQWDSDEKESDNFEPLKSLAWQLHVYGESSTGLIAICKELQLPLYQFAWRTQMKAAGFMRNAFYLVRPDGYLAVADMQTRAGRLRDYFRTNGLHPQSLLSSVEDELDGRKPSDTLSNSS